jgi:uncharacterized membrane protein YkoI
MRTILAALAIAVATATVSPALADGKRDRDEERRDLAGRGQAILPIGELLRRLQSEIDGEFVGIELDDDDDDGRAIYEVYYLDTAGRRHELEVDATTGAILDRDVDDD